MILVTGSKGQLGQEVTKLLDENKIEYVGYDSSDLDITNRNLVISKLTELKPEYVIHCAAYTKVDAAEDEGRLDNYLVNVEGTKNIALACEKVGATLFFVSTDYVFDGSKVHGEYLPSDETSPLNEYGYSKESAELLVEEICSKYYIIRTSWVFGEYGNNFVYTMLKLAQQHPKLTIIGDQVGRPTWTKTLADFILYLINKPQEYGIYHLSNDGICSWYEFAKEILKNEEVEVVEITSDQFPQKATRPMYSVMSLDKTKATGFNIMDWKESLDLMLKR